MKTWIRSLFTIILLSSINNACSVLTLEGVSPTLKSVSTLTTTVPPITHTPKATNLVVSEFDSTCWPIKYLQEAESLNGSLVYIDFNSSDRTEPSGLFTWDLSSFQSKVVELDPSQLKSIKNGGQVSPDGKWIAILSGNNLLLISQDSVRSFPLPYEDVSISDYLPDGRILLVSANLHEERKDHYREGVGITDIYFLFDPATGEMTKHTVFLPNFETGKRETFAIHYSYNMKYVVYRSTHGVDSLGYLDVKFTLYDLERNEMLWVGPAREEDLVNSPDSVIGWQPNTNNLTAMYFIKSTDEDNYYSISLDGKVSPLTNFDGLTLYNLSGSSWSSSAYWSPNGRYLVSAGENVVSPDAASFLIIWDNQMRVGYKPCLPNERQRVLPYSFLWSYSESLFMVTLVFAPSPPTTDTSPPEYVTQTYILDLANKIIYEMPDENRRGEFSTLVEGKDYVILGWVNWEIP